MKKFLTFLLFLIPAFLVTRAQKHSLVQLWSTDAIVNTPESVLPDLKNNLLYVSLIDGGPWDVDGKGGIGHMTTAGTHYDSLWITGLNAPKGLGMYKDKMYAADISEVVVVDIPKGRLIRKIPIEGASGLNDITVTDKGVVFVSDSKTGRIWKLENEKPILYLENVTGANGLKAVKDGLVYAKGPGLMIADDKKQIRQIADIGHDIDGIEPIGNGDYLATSWVGYTYYVYANGQTELLLDTHSEKKNTADIGYDPVKKIVYVPTFFDKRIVAYQLTTKN
ncbi:MAG TPA: ATP-binding protein [Puia sp.]|nr:ATP-binding protein [Puia sp.]